MIRGASDPKLPIDRVPWSPTQTAIGTLATLGPLLAINIFSAIAANTTSGPTSLSHQEDLSLGITNFIISSLLEAVFLIAPIYYARRYRAIEERGPLPANVRNTLGLRGFDARLALGLLVLSATFVLVISFLYDAITTKFGISSPTNLDQLISEYHQMPITIILTLVAAVLVAPICEELFFRSFLLQGLRGAGMPTWGAIVLSALIFAAVHLQGGSFLLLFVLALCLGTLRVVTRSVWPGVILHTLNNALAFVVLIQAVR
jgi:uncharacterized protein